MSEKKPLLSKGAQTPTRDPFVVNSLNYSTEVEDGSINVLAQHNRYKYYAKLHTKEKLVGIIKLRSLILPIFGSCGMQNSDKGVVGLFSQIFCMPLLYIRSAPTFC